VLVPTKKSKVRQPPVLEHGELASYYLAHSARADMYRRLGDS
jgi:hypothetical protein